MGCSFSPIVANHSSIPHIPAFVIFSFQASGRTTIFVASITKTMKMRRFLLIVSILASSLLSPVFAQFPTTGTSQPKALPGTAGDQSPKGSAKISGSVVDSATSKAIEFVSIALYDKANNKAVDGTVADEKGKFTLTKLAAGDYKVLISFIGYATKPSTTSNLPKARMRTSGRSASAPTPRPSMK
jgi:hypothetical protein